MKLTVSELGRLRGALALAIEDRECLIDAYKLPHKPGYMDSKFVAKLRTQIKQYRALNEKLRSEQTKRNRQGVRSISK